MTSSDLLLFTERGSGPPLLLVHGLMVSGDMFEPVVDQLATHHRVIVPDLRGHGRSRALPPPYTVRQLAADLLQLLDHLDIRSADVLGYSQAAAVAKQLALDHPDQCSRLILGCTYAFNMATRRGQIEGHIAPILVGVLGPRLFAKIGVALGAKELGKERAARLVGRLMGDQDRKLLVMMISRSSQLTSRPVTTGRARGTGTYEPERASWAALRSCRLGWGAFAAAWPATSRRGGRDLQRHIPEVEPNPEVMPRLKVPMVL